MQNGCFLCWFPWYSLVPSIYPYKIFCVCLFLTHVRFVYTDTVPIRTVNRQCSSGLQAVADVAAAIRAGFYDIGKPFLLESLSLPKSANSLKKDCMFL